MLPSQHRLRRSADFGLAVRQGRRASRPLLTVHLLLTGGAAASGQDVPPDAGPPLIGLVVGKAVGGSVVRSRTSRRLRHLLRDRLHVVPPGALLVVRAAPGAGTASSAALAEDLDRALAVAVRPRPARSAGGRSGGGA